MKLQVWLRRVQMLLKQQQDGIQSVVNRALLCLPRRKHIKFISQTAILEFKCGVPDRARSMFEGILREYPKRTDLWSIYLDQVSSFFVPQTFYFHHILATYILQTYIKLGQEIRLGDVDVIRALFERATSLSLPPKKMKVSIPCINFIFEGLLVLHFLLCFNSSSNLQFLFKKYLEYEKSHGDEEKIEYVKRKAMEYVETTLS